MKKLMISLSLSLSFLFASAQSLYVVTSSTATFANYSSVTNFSYQKVFTTTPVNSPILQNLYEVDCDCDVDDLLETMSLDPLIAIVEKIPVFEPLMAPPDDYDGGYNKQWYFNPDHLNVEGAWTLLNAADPKVPVAVVDCLLDHDNRDFCNTIANLGASGLALFRANTPNSIGMYQNGGVHPDCWYVDPACGTDLSATGGCINSTCTSIGSHGIGVAGLIACETDNGIGLAGGAYNKADLYFYDGLNLPNVVYASVRGVKVINCSFGTTNAWNGFSHVGQAMINEAYQNGAMIFAAAGNHGGYAGTNCNAGVPPGHSGRHLIYPASYNNVTSVTKTESQIGAATTDVFADGGYNKCVDFSAPGESVRIHDGEDLHHITSLPRIRTNGTGNGTSLSSPMVASIATLCFSVNPALNAKQVDHILKKTAVNVYGDDRLGVFNSWFATDNLLGDGMPDAGAAVSMARTFNPATSVPYANIPCQGAVPNLDCSNIKHNITTWDPNNNQTEIIQGYAEGGTISWSHDGLGTLTFPNGPTGDQAVYHADANDIEFVLVIMTVTGPGGVESEAYAYINIDNTIICTAGGTETLAVRELNSDPYVEFVYQWAVQPAGAATIVNGTTSSAQIIPTGSPAITSVTCQASPLREDQTVCPVVFTRTFNYSSPSEISYFSSGPICDKDPDFQLLGTPAGGAWSGAVGPTGIFSPTTVGVGDHIVTYTAPGNFCPENITIPVYNVCCPGSTGGAFTVDQVISAGTYTPSNLPTPIPGESWYIDGDIELVGFTNLIFEDIDFYIRGSMNGTTVTGSKITIRSSTVTFDNLCTLQSSCDEMWYGIVLEEEADFRFSNARMEDAFKGVSATSDVIGITIRDSEFFNNYNGVSWETVLQFPIGTPEIVGNNFWSDGNLKSPHNNWYSNAHILIRAEDILLGSVAITGNTFSDTKYGIFKEDNMTVSNGTNLIFSQNIFTDCFDAGVYIGKGAGNAASVTSTSNTFNYPTTIPANGQFSGTTYGIYADHDITSSRDKFFGTNDAAYAKDQYGIWHESSYSVVQRIGDISIDRAKFSKLNYGLSTMLSGFVCNGPSIYKDNAYIEDNLFDDCEVGIEFRENLTYRNYLQANVGGCVPSMLSNAEFTVQCNDFNKSFITSTNTTCIAVAANTDMSDIGGCNPDKPAGNEITPVLAANINALMNPNAFIVYSFYNLTDEVFVTSFPIGNVTPSNCFESVTMSTCPHRSNGVGRQQGTGNGNGTISNEEFRPFVLGEAVPNPSEGEFRIFVDLNNEFKDAKIQIRSLLSDRIVETRKVKFEDKSIMVNLIGETPGIYFYSLIVDGKTVATKKLVLIK